LAVSQAAGVSRSVAEPAAVDTRRWLMLALLLVGQFMGLIDALIVNVAVPQIGADLHASGATLQFVVGGYVIAYAMLLITGARLGAMYGRRRMFLTGAVVFTLASAGCGLAPSSAVLVALRCVQGAGAAVMVPQMLSVIQLQFTGPARAKALSAYGAVLSTGAVAGLVLGGVLVNANLFGATWRPVFLVNVPIGLLLVVLVPRLVPADHPGSGLRLDVAGLLLAVPTVVLVVVPLVLGHQLGWPGWTYLSITLGLVLGAVFVAYERHVSTSGGAPLLNLAVLTAPGLGAGLTSLSCMQMAYGGFLFVFTLHLQAGLGDSALRAGLTYLPMAAAFGLVGFYWRRLPARLHPFVGVTGLALCAIGYLGVALSMADATRGSAALWSFLLLTGIGLGLSASPLLTQSLLRVPPAHAADASGVLTTTVQLSQVVGIAVFGSIYFSLKTTAASALPQALSSAHALSSTCCWLAAVAVLGALTATVLSRQLLRANNLSSKEVTAPGH